MFSFVIPTGTYSYNAIAEYISICCSKESATLYNKLNREGDKKNWTSLWILEGKNQFLRNSLETNDNNLTPNNNDSNDDPNLM